jgi:hypothetical protein
MMEFVTREEQAILDLCVKHGLYEKDAWKQLRALYGQGNKGPYTAVVRAVLDEEGVEY